MTQTFPKIWAGFITYGAVTAPYLDDFLASLAAQEGQLRLIVWDNTPEAQNANLDILGRYPAVRVRRSGENVGFSRGYNALIREAVAAGAEYFFVINPDTLVEPGTVAALAAALEADPSLGSVAPKLLRWDFARKQKTRMIDSCGLRLSPGLRFTDIGQGEEDSGQYDTTAIIGPSGAAGLYRLSALQAIAENGQYFDERFFMYKEDCDLAYRLHLAGYSSRLIPDALVYHDRSASGGSLRQRAGNRFFSRSKDSRRQAFRNQHFLFIKYWQRQDFWGKIMIVAEIKLRFLAAVLAEPYLLKEYPSIFAQAKGLRRY